MTRRDTTDANDFFEGSCDSSSLLKIFNSFIKHDPQPSTTHSDVFDAKLCRFQMSQKLRPVLLPQNDTRLSLTEGDMSDSQTVYEVTFSREESTLKESIHAQLPGRQSGT